MSIIRKLDETVINRIAAGEVIQRPANALKEMLENSIDAGATNIQIVLKEGGLKLLQIQDNGSGIRKEDLDIVCERFTTSKLRVFEDLQAIGTFGFRGEALASISHVSFLSITTRTADAKCAYKGSYVDGKPKGPAKPCAGNVGTQITVEDLFYNMLTRKKAFKSHSEEHAKVVDVVSRYAIHNPSVGFSVKKYGEGKTDVRTPNNSTYIDNIRTIYGVTLAKELLEVSCEDEELKLKFHGLVTNANFSLKKCTCLLFINHRLVDCSKLRKGIEHIYVAYLPKNSHPFLYLSLEIAPENVDVNVHPTKHEVFFLHEDSVVEKIQRAIDTALLGANTSRTFFTQSLLPCIKASAAKVNEELKLTNPKGDAAVYAHNMVRTDSATQKLDAFLHSVTKSVTKSLETKSLESLPVPMDVDEPSQCGTSGVTKKPEQCSLRREVQLTSILDMQAAIKNETHPGLRDLFKNHIFVGCVNQEFALVQHETKLYLIDVPKICEAYFYQLVVFDFCNFGAIRLSTPTPLYDLAIVGVENEDSGWTEEDGPKEDLARQVECYLKTKAEMLDDYFSMEIDEEGNLRTFPMLLEKYVPALEGLPMYILRLTTEVNWEEERECFETIARETSLFYSRVNVVDDTDTITSDPTNSSQSQEEQQPNWQWIVEHVLFSSLKSNFLPPKSCCENGSILQVANLPDLYKVFERC